MAPPNKPTERWMKHLELREGVVGKSYLDSLKKPTGGVGHLLSEEEIKMYPIGTKIKEDVWKGWLAADSSKAYSAGVEQASEMKHQSQDMVEALASVNFQLGTGWRRKFPSAWKALKSGNYDEAIAQVSWIDPKNKGKGASHWKRQTPVRVRDFVNTIEQMKSDSQNPAFVARDVSREKPKKTEPTIIHRPKKKDIAQEAVFNQERKASQGLTGLAALQQSQARTESPRSEKSRQARRDARKAREDARKS
jgi:GH24 family phage-related lysozyme (muramidase)